MRKYQPAWNQLKNNPSEPLRIAVHRNYHKRVYKAIIKEKWMDQVFHLEQSMAGNRTTLSSSSQGDVLTINLHIIPPLESMFQ